MVRENFLEVILEKRPKKEPAVIKPGEGVLGRESNLYRAWGNRQLSMAGSGNKQQAAQ